VTDEQSFPQRLAENSSAPRTRTGHGNGTSDYAVGWLRPAWKLLFRLPPKKGLGLAVISPGPRAIGESLYGSGSGQQSRVNTLDQNHPTNLPPPGTNYTAAGTSARTPDGCNRQNTHPFCDSVALCPTAKAQTLPKTPVP